jgi:hypothetical protein
MSLKSGQYIRTWKQIALNFQMDLLSLEFLQYGPALVSRKITRIRPNDNWIAAGGGSSLEEFEQTDKTRRRFGCLCENKCIADGMVVYKMEEH